MRKLVKWFTLLGMVSITSACTDGDDVDFCADIGVSPEPVPPLSVGDTLRLVGTGLDSDGNSLGVMLAWESRTPSVLSVSVSGTVVGVTPGDGIAKASCLPITPGNESKDVLIQVTPAPVQESVLEQCSNQFGVCGAVRLRTTTDAGGTTAELFVANDGNGTAQVSSADSLPIHAVVVWHPTDPLGAPVDLVVETRGPVDTIRSIERAQEWTLKTSNLPGGEEAITVATTNFADDPDVSDNAGIFGCAVGTGLSGSSSGYGTCGPEAQIYFRFRTPVQWSAAEAELFFEFATGPNATSGCGLHVWPFCADR